MSGNSNPSINSPASTNHELDTLVGDNAIITANLLQEFNDRQTRHISVSSNRLIIGSVCPSLPHSIRPRALVPSPASSTHHRRRGGTLPPLYPLGQLRPSSAWRTTPSPTPHRLSPTASSRPSTAAVRSPTNASPSPVDASTNSKERCTQGRPKSVASEAATPPPKCPPATNATEGEWTSKCPPMAERTSSQGGSESWVTGRSSPEPASEPTSQNMWSPYTFHQTTQRAPPPYSPPGSSSSSKQTEAPTTPWLRRRVDSLTPQPSQKWSDTAATTCTEPSSKWPAEPSSPTSTKKTTCFRGLN